MRLELTILGTASQSPTRDRAQGGYLLQWADERILFDPGEGCQRQLLFAGTSAAQVDRVCITHFHGDHCLGLPGFLQSRALATERRVTIHYPRSGQAYVDHMLAGSAIDFDLRADLMALEPGERLVTPNFDIVAAALQHPVPTIGFRLEGRPARHLIADRLDEEGISGALVADLIDEGVVESPDGDLVELAEVSEVLVGPTMAFVMDTSICEGARELAREVDLLVCESTFLETDADLAEDRGHLTALQAARLAAESDAGLLVLSHFSNRYPDLAAFESEARSIHSNCVAAADLSCIAIAAAPRP